MKQEIVLLQAAAQEIKDLRRQVEIMSTRLEMFDNMMAILNARVPQQGMTHRVDPLADIEKFLEWSKMQREKLNDGPAMADADSVERLHQEWLKK